MYRERERENTAQEDKDKLRPSILEKIRGKEGNLINRKTSLTFSTSPFPETLTATTSRKTRKIETLTSTKTH